MVKKGALPRQTEAEKGGYSQRGDNSLLKMLKQRQNNMLTEEGRTEIERFRNNDDPKANNAGMLPVRRIKLHREIERSVTGGNDKQVTFYMQLDYQNNDWAVIKKTKNVKKKKL